MPADLRASRTVAQPFWFGPADRPLFGWLHLPQDRDARGGVVLCQPLGIEAACVYFSYRLLADRLAELGLAVVRFDYDGTGDSAGLETDADRVGAWLASVSAATDVLAATGVASLGLVGVRIGALFAAREAARRGGVDALVLWDPCNSGREFLREQRFLRVMGTGGQDHGETGVDAPGIRFEPETVQELSHLRIPELDVPLATRLLVLTPPESSRPRGLERRLAGMEVDWQDATGQVELLDSNLQTPPMDTIGRVAAWLSDALHADPVRVTLPLRQSAAVAATGAGRPILEHSVELGILRLFGIVTERTDGSESPTVVLVNEGNTHHIGQARIWVDLARELAASGFRVLRFDLSGNGDSGVRPGQVQHVSHAPEAIADIREAALAVSPGHPADVVLVGFCSGAYNAIEQALEHPTRGVCIINPVFSFPPPEPMGTHPRPARQTTRPWFVDLVDGPVRWLAHRRSPTEVDRWTKALRLGTWPSSLAQRRAGIPKPVWWLVSRALLEHTPAATLERMVGAGVDTLLITGAEDYLPISLGSECRMHELKRSGRFRLVLLDELGHASWDRDDRLRLIKELTDHLVGRFGPGRRGPGPSAPVDGPA